MDTKIIDKEEMDEMGYIREVKYGPVYEEIISKTLALEGTKVLKVTFDRNDKTLPNVRNLKYCIDKHNKDNPTTQIRFKLRNVRNQNPIALFFKVQPGEVSKKSKKS